MINIKNKVLGCFLGFCILFAVLAVVAVFSRLSFKKDADSKLMYNVNFKSLEFALDMTEQIVLVKQLMRSPLVIDYMEHPFDEDIKKLAVLEFSAFQESFAGKSVFWISNIELGFYNNGEKKYVIDPNAAENYWYKMTMYETRDYNFNINYNPQLNSTMLWINAVIRNAKDEPVGIVGTGVPMTDFLNRMYHGIDDSIEMYFYNDSLEITGAKDQSVLENPVKITEKIPDLIDMNIETDVVHRFASGTHEYVIAPLNLLNWNVILRTPFGIREFLRYAHTPFSICVVIILVSACLFVSINLISQITTLRGAVENLSSGNADLTQRIKLKSNSILKIVNQLVDSVNKFIIKLQSTVSEVKGASDSMIKVGGDMHSCTQDAAASIEQISATIDSMGRNIDTQVASVEETSSVVNQMSSNIDSLNRMINTQVDSVTQASAAVEQMIGNIDSVNSSVSILSESFKVLEKKTAEGVAKQEETNTRIQRIQEQSKMLKDANKIISSIAEQTSLLAMNAAIEAAHAGESGKGFSVVADEIRKLSENSSSQSKTIGDQLKTIEDSVTEIVGVSQDSKDVLSAVVHDLQGTNGLVQEITGAMQEQKAGSRQIRDALNLLNSNSSEVKNASGEMAIGNKAIMREIQKLGDASLGIKNGMNEMSIGAERMRENGTALAALSSDMEKSINNIDVQLSQFKI